MTTMSTPMRSMPMMSTPSISMSTPMTSAPMPMMSAPMPMAQPMPMMSAPMVPMQAPMQVMYIDPDQVEKEESRITHGMNESKAREAMAKVPKFEAEAKVKLVAA